MKTVSYYMDRYSILLGKEPEKALLKISESSTEEIQVLEAYKKFVGDQYFLPMLWRFFEIDSNISSSLIMGIDCGNSNNRT